MLAHLLHATKQVRSVAFDFFLLRDPSSSSLVFSSSVPLVQSTQEHRASLPHGGLEAGCQLQGNSPEDSIAPTPNRARQCKVVIAMVIAMVTAMITAMITAMGAALLPLVLELFRTDLQPEFFFEDVRTLLRSVTDQVSPIAIPTDVTYFSHGCHAPKGLPGSVAWPASHGANDFLLLLRRARSTPNW